MAGTLNAFIDEELSLDGATDGPLVGASFAVKDLFDIAGHVTLSGNPDWGRTHDAATENALSVDQLLAAGASMHGKTITDEFAFSIVGENHHYGTPVNPNAPGRTCGGSSSGSASAVAGELVDFALGTDTGGSVRVPASFCGIFGLRPTHGRLSSHGIFPLAPSFDTAGWFARDPNLLRRVGSVLLADHKPAASPVRRLLFPTDVWGQASEGAQEALAPAVSALEARFGGAERMELTEGEGLDSWFQAFRMVQGAEIWQSLKDWVAKHDPEIGPGIKERLAWCSTIDEETRAAADLKRASITRRIAEITADGTVLVLPVAPGPALKAGESAVASDDIRALIIKFSGVAPMAKVPQISLPLAKVEGCPIALTVMAAQGMDEALLDLAVECCGKAENGIAGLAA